MVESARLKQKLSDMFRWFHAFCTENNLRYYALGGTMLGAARHQGFIPWDDDIDVGMPRPDYIRLEQLLRNPSGRYMLETPNSTNPDFFYPFSKRYDTETTLIENTRYKTKRGVYLDIFPLDGAGNTPQEAELTFEKVWKKRRLLLAMTAGYRKGRSFHKNLAVFAARLIPHWIIDPKQLLRELDASCAQKDYNDCLYICNFYGAWGKREILPRSTMGEPSVYSFEDFTAFGSEDYDGYLTGVYGDWRRLPPVEKRVSHHDFLYINLEESFLVKGKK